MSMATTWVHLRQFKMQHRSKNSSYKIVMLVFCLMYCSLLIIFSSPFCLSAKMIKLCVPERKKSSTSLRPRRSTSCDHSGDSSDCWHDWPIVHYLWPGLLREPSVEPSVIQCPSPPPSDTPNMPYSPPPSIQLNHFCLFPSPSHFITQKLGSSPGLCFRCG